ncbi:uncharacterized protein LOC112095340 [Morus notabilis]|uniref:uncharacterized protein LOC112095340 n=1 Tax=Morus notabilis TaxID=981085 RepID=UPI000CED76B3|nr:uncharacterized protein LOC112095340 [Morus notabilis]
MTKGGTRGDCVEELEKKLDELTEKLTGRELPNSLPKEPGKEAVATPAVGTEEATTGAGQSEPWDLTATGVPPGRRLHYTVRTDGLRPQGAALEVEPPPTWAGGRYNHERRCGPERWEVGGDRRRVGEEIPPWAGGEPPNPFPHRRRTGGSPPRVDLPPFDGEGWPVWERRAERYFRVHLIRPDVRVQVVADFLSRRAWEYYEWVMEEEPGMDWEELKFSFGQRFGPREFRSIQEQLVGLRQRGSVAEYGEQFQELSARVRGMDQATTLGIFLNGLNQDLQDDVRMWQPRSVHEAIQLGLQLEHKLKAQGNRGRGGHLSPFQVPLQTTNRLGTNRWGSGCMSNPHPILGNTQKLVEGGGTSAAQLERQRWKDNRECFRTRKKTAPPEGRGSTDSEEEEGLLLLQPDLRLQALAGINGGETLKLYGRVQQKQVTILIDSGANSSFISWTKVKELGLTVVSISEYTIKVGDGYCVTTDTVCRGVCLEVSGLTFELDLYPFEIPGVDVVLGAGWLRTLGTFRANFRHMWLEFELKGKVHWLVGVSALSREPVSITAVAKMAKKGEECYLVQWQSTLSPNARKEGATTIYMEELEKEYESVFSGKLGLPPSRTGDHAIVLHSGAKPPNIRPYQYPHAQKNEIERLIADMTLAGIIRPSQSPYSSPVLLVRKDGSWRFCVDYRELNKLTVPDKFPIPIIEELLEELHGASCFSKLDLKSGYHQIRMRREDVEKTAFRTHEGYYEFLVMPFGLTNAPATFQAMMTELFKPLLRKFVLVFLDDILVYSHSSQEHLGHLRTVLGLLKDGSFVLNLKKCLFFQDTVEYLGHYISHGGVTADPGKIRAMVEWPVPTTVKGVRGFLGLMGYYRRFVKNYGAIARPLTELLKKGEFTWSKEAHRAFQELKRRMTETLILALPDFKDTFEVDTDASGAGIGAVLLQQGRPVAYYSKGLSPRTMAKSVYERELMALVLAIQKWRVYLLGRKFVVHTDQKSLRFLLEQRISSPAQQKWLVKLMGFEFDIHYRAGKENIVADALSRRGGWAQGGELLAISGPQFLDMALVERERAADAKLRTLKEQLSREGAQESHYAVERGVLLH